MKIYPEVRELSEELDNEKDIPIVKRIETNQQMEEEEIIQILMFNKQSHLI